tara:strand:- start:1861 stop:2049 length:189 start_codon:yes stop_codon:yes gene_type:complete
MGEMKKNQITPGDMTLIMEGLRSIILKGKTERDANRVKQAQQLYDRLNEYATEFSQQHQESE